jgi:hypothetical protein
MALRVLVWIFSKINISQQQLVQPLLCYFVCTFFCSELWENSTKNILSQFSYETPILCLTLATQHSVDIQLKLALVTQQIISFADEEKQTVSNKRSKKQTRRLHAEDVKKLTAKLTARAERNYIRLTDKSITLPA